MKRDLITEMKKIRIKLGELWDTKGRTDQEILELSMEYDNLMNQYYRKKKHLTGEF